MLGVVALGVVGQAVGRRMLVTNATDPMVENSLLTGASNSPAPEPTLEPVLRPGDVLGLEPVALRRLAQATAILLRWGSMPGSLVPQPKHLPFEGDRLVWQRFRGGCSHELTRTCLSYDTWLGDRSWLMALLLVFLSNCWSCRVG